MLLIPPIDIYLPLGVVYFICRSIYSERMINMTSEEQFSLPNNIKQIGSIGDGLRIYMEDYVCTYIQQFAASDKDREKTGILVGRYCQIDGQETIFVSGIIQGRYTTRHNGMTCMTERSWQYTAKQMERYFNDCEIVGWLYVQPGFEDYINENLCSFQKENADRGLRLLYLTDPQEGISSFYTWDRDGSIFTLLKGYLVYYDKNEGMHEYMLDNKLNPVNTTPELEMPEREDAGAKARRAAAKPAVRISSRTGSRGKVSAEKNMINMLGAASFIMLMVCMVMGAGLIQNSERLSNMEGKLNQLQAELEGTKSVFAAQTTTAAEAVTQPSTAQITQTTQAAQAVQPTQAATAVQPPQPVNAPQPAQPTTQKQAQAEAPRTYTVENGDTLINISEKIYGTADKVQEIKELNNKSTNTIFAGETIKLP